MTLSQKLIAITICILLARQAKGAEVTLTPDKILRVDFEIAGPYSPTPDVLYLAWGPTPPLVNAIGSRHARLFHGPNLLGENVDPAYGGFVGELGLGPSNQWKSATSIWSWRSPTVVDFGTLFSGNQFGHIDFFIESGQMKFDTDEVQIVHIVPTSEHGGYLPLPLPKILAISFVPEPSACLLLVLAVAGFHFQKGSRKY